MGISQGEDPNPAIGLVTTMAITAQSIVENLKQKHYKDVCVEQCKTGPSITSKYLGIIDLWVMNKSWADQKFTAYEVKVSRQDFLRDDKWRLYLPFCNELYFAAPKGIIDPIELPAEVGLLVTAGSRMITKKKAIFRNIEIPQSLLVYILMWRAQITRTDIGDKRCWSAWLEEKQKNKLVGHEVERFIGKSKREEIAKNNIEIDKARVLSQSCSDVVAFLSRIGVDINTAGRWGLVDRVEKALGAHEVLRAVNNAIYALNNLKKEITLPTGEPNGVQVDQNV